MRSSLQTVGFKQLTFKCASVDFGVVHVLLLVLVELVLAEETSAAGAAQEPLDAVLRVGFLVQLQLGRRTAFEVALLTSELAEICVRVPPVSPHGALACEPGSADRTRVVCFVLRRIPSVQEPDHDFLCGPVALKVFGNFGGAVQRATAHRTSVLEVWCRYQMRWPVTEMRFQFIEGVEVEGALQAAVRREAGQCVSVGQQ